MSYQSTYAGRPSENCYITLIIAVAHHYAPQEVSANVHEGFTARCQTWNHLALVSRQWSAWANCYNYGEDGETVTCMAESWGLWDCSGHHSRHAGVLSVYLSGDKMTVFVSSFSRLKSAVRQFGEPRMLQEEVTFASSRAPFSLFHLQLCRSRRKKQNMGLWQKPTSAENHSIKNKMCVF